MKKFFKIGCGFLGVIFVILFFVIYKEVKTSSLEMKDANKDGVISEREEFLFKKKSDSLEKYVHGPAREKRMFDKIKDTDKDGTVSEEEELQYEEKIKQEKIELERKRKEEYNKCNSTDIAKIKSKYNYVLDVLVIDYRIYLVERVGANGNRLTITVNYSNKPDCF